MCGRRFLRETAAGPVVEFAIVVPILIFLLIGMIDFALAFNQRLNVVSVTRDLARMLSVEPDPCAATVIATLRNRANATFIRLDSRSPQLGGYVQSIVTCPATSVTVAVNAYPLRTTFLRINYTLSARASFRWERAN
jgi:Flp pilus assembly protein TadG